MSSLQRVSRAPEAAGAAVDAGVQARGGGALDLLVEGAVRGRAKPARHGCGDRRAEVPSWLVEGQASVCL
jgi:hypothetical protein